MAKVFCYCLQDGKTNLFKIGESDDPKVRTADALMSPNVVMRGYRIDILQNDLHKVFHHFRLRHPDTGRFTEWFRGFDAYHMAKLMSYFPAVELDYNSRPDDKYINDHLKSEMYEESLCRVLAAQGITDFWWWNRLNPFQLRTAVIQDIISTNRYHLGRGDLIIIDDVSSKGSPEPRYSHRMIHTSRDLEDKGHLIKPERADLRLTRAGFERGMDTYSIKEREVLTFNLDFHMSHTKEIIKSQFMQHPGGLFAERVPSMHEQRAKGRIERRRLKAVAMRVVPG